MAKDDPKSLVSTAWLEEHLFDPDLRILDASMYLPGVERDAKADIMLPIFQVHGFLTLMT